MWGWLMRRLVVVEPQAGASGGLSESLEQQGFLVRSAADPGDVPLSVDSFQADALICSFDLDDRDAVDLCLTVRSASDIPVVVVGDPDPGAVLATLDAGADKFVSEDGTPEMLAARIRALLRRVGRLPITVRRRVDVAEVEIDLDSLVVRRSGERIDVSSNELDVLLRLCRRPGAVVQREDLIEHIWGYGCRADAALRTTVKRLRRKVETDPVRPEVVKTARGIGYYLGVE